MLDILRSRLSQGHRTISLPRTDLGLPEGFRGRPELHPEACLEGCRACEAVCPTGAITWREGQMKLDLGSCLFCPQCVEACPEGALSFTQGHAMAVRERADLHVSGRELAVARQLDDAARRVFGRSLKLRQVCTGGCNACEADLNVLNTVVFDLGRFGIQFVASPRHADCLVVTGPLTHAMRGPLLEAFEAMPSPKLVVAVGACAISGGPFKGHLEVGDGIGSALPIDLYIPGCPPHPFTLLDGLLRLLGKLPALR